MSYVIAMTDKKLSHHFSKSEIFSFYDENKRQVAVYKNPALGVKGCTGKNLLIELFKARQCHTVIVRKVGEKTLARLLDAGFKVEQGSTRDSIEELLADASASKNSLTDASQGVASKASCCGHH